MNHTDQIYNSIRKLHPLDMIEIAKSYRNLASKIEREAREKSKSLKTFEDWKRKLDTMHGVPDAVMGLTKKGVPLPDAIKTVSKTHGYRVNTINNQLAIYRKREKRARIEKRNLEIIQLARSGLNKTQIAEKIGGISRSQVSRVIKRHLFRFE